jgi:Homeodomain-like domain-containing protein
MRRARPISGVVKESLGRLLKETRSKWEFQRVQCVWMRAELGLGAKDIAKAVGWNPGYVRQVQARFLREGETSLKLVGRGGGVIMRIFRLSRRRSFWSHFFLELNGDRFWW